MTQVQHLSLSKFCKTYDAPKSSAWAKAQELGIDTSKGLSPADQALLISELGLDASIVDESTIVHAPQTEVLPPNGYGKAFEMGLPDTVNVFIVNPVFSVNSGNADHFSAVGINADQKTQQLMQAGLQHQTMQGQQDNQEVEAIAQAYKSQQIQARIGGIVQGSAPNPDAPATGG